MCMFLANIRRVNFVWSSALTYLGRILGVSYPCQLFAKEAPPQKKLLDPLRWYCYILLPHEMSNKKRKKCWTSPRFPARWRNCRKVAVKNQRVFCFGRNRPAWHSASLCRRSHRKSACHMQTRTVQPYDFPHLQSFHVGFFCVFGGCCLCWGQVRKFYLSKKISVFFLCEVGGGVFGRLGEGGKL